MSEDGQALTGLLPAYAGHGDGQARRLSDQQVRAYAGESLVDLQDRLAVGPVQDRFDALLMRCEFGDQHVIKALEDARFAEPEAAAAVESCDRALVEVAGRARDVDAAGLEAFVADLERAFDDRAAAVSARLKR